MLLSVNWLCHKITVRCISSTRSVAYHQHAVLHIINREVVYHHDLKCISSCHRLVYHQPQGCISSRLEVYIIKPSACISSTAGLHIITAYRVYHQHAVLHKNPSGSVCFCHFLPCFHIVLKTMAIAFLGFDFSGALFRFSSIWLRAPIFLLDILFFICYNICANI